MAVIRPFVGTRYNDRAVGDLAQVLAPPYDVISPQMQEELHGRHPHNVVRLELGKDEKGDDGYCNRYSRAAGFFATWRDEGVMLDDEKPSLYLYTQTFSLPDGRRLTRRGFFAAVELMELGPGGIMAHERTFDGPKADRLTLMQASHANFSAIFGLYTDPDGRADRVIAERMAKERPWSQATTDDGIEHALWVINEPEVIRELQSILAGKGIYIADGHHRYETALKYAQECRREGKTAKNGPGPADHVMMYLVNTEDPGLVILPTHRVLHRDLAADVEEFKEDVAAGFDILPLGLDWDREPAAAARVQAALAEAGRDRTAFAMLLPRGDGAMLVLRPGAAIDTLIDDPMPREKKVLDATILHAFVINRCWIGNPDYDIDEEECRYVRDIGEAMDLLRAKRHCVAFLMNPTTMDQLKAISAIGERMPQKSTYFYPKVVTGIVTRDLHQPLG